jgi:hypothetical protein
MKNAPRLRNFVIKGAKRLLQHYLPTADIHRWAVSDLSWIMTLALAYRQVAWL